MDAFAGSRTRVADYCFGDDLAFDRGFHCAKPQRCIADADGADMNICRLTVFAVVIKKRNPGQRKVTAPAGEFLEAPTAIVTPRRQANFNNELV